MVDSGLASVLRMANAIRNKCAHNLVYNPSDPELQSMYDALHRRNLNDVSAVEENEENCWQLLCRLLEERAIELGVTDI